ncbi:hypothetical protein CONCODRAFT_73501 [Conidiobolus coronatus NRRL 28638]|uniref:Polynucleotide adenylyltransferase n=1 Tax=Conidiobolus coronatus (strain ATCC 28846 / CBS 209.66 / NRRL 28638) TaxID=796925 RepID=A0A137NVS4_CONC2|nr:hypothetical protein CONCODRAFT_73501 [Conidiobolus coronatus NRRL 28638]|eukprot:KXN66704.1 hypothetical protein CONCODRAFT_73501 [Conidiobolus coronatus NRRL 28638]
MTPNDYRRAFLIEKRIWQAIGHKLTYEIDMIPFGSVPIKLGICNADCDFLIKFPNNLSKDDINGEFDDIINTLVDNGYKLLLDWKTKAGERVIKFKDYNGIGTIDIGIYSEMLLRKTMLIDSYASLHPDIKKAILLIKIWAHRRELNNPSTTHVINSYCHVLMFITYLIIIGAIPNLRTTSPKLRIWKTKGIKYCPIMNPIQDPGTDRICSRYSEIVIDGNADIPVYFKENLVVKLGSDWNIQKAITGYFYFMGFKFDYLNWDISIYHGGIIKSSQSIDSITPKTKLLRIRHPFKPDQIESNAALPWCVDGLKWEFMRGYYLLSDSDWNELMIETGCPNAKDIYFYNMYTYISLY